MADAFQVPHQRCAHMAAADDKNVHMRHLLVVFCCGPAVLAAGGGVGGSKLPQSIGSVYHICPEGENSPRIKIFVQAVREYDILVQL